LFGFELIDIFGFDLNQSFRSGFIFKNLFTVKPVVIFYGFGTLFGG
jgi:hypothetical protein